MIRHAILAAREKWHAAIVVSSHQHQWLQTFCDRIVDLHNGRILTHSLQNILTGPWHYLDKHNVARILSDAQIISLPAPPSPGPSPVLPPGAITLITGAIDRFPDNMLRGKITSVLVQDGADDRICLHILCGEQKLIMELSRDQWQTMQLQPGQFVFAGFSSADIVWLPA